MFKVVPIIAKNPFSRITRAAIGAGMDLAAKGVVHDYEAEVRHWHHKPKFAVARNGDFTREVVTDDEIFHYQDAGTKGPYPILPRRKRALFWRGARHPARRVMHPGLKAQGFTKRVQAKASAKVLATLNAQFAKKAP